MKDLSLHILDIAENSINASATEISIKIIEDTRENILSIEISDNGKGMDEETIKKFTTLFLLQSRASVPALGFRCWPSLQENAVEI